MTPDRIMPSARAAFSERSMTLPRMKRPAVVDAALNRAAAVAHPDDASKRPRAVSTGHPVARSTVVGSKSGFGRSGRDEKGKGGNR